MKKNARKCRICNKIKNTDEFIGKSFVCKECYREKERKKTEKIIRRIQKTELNFTGAFTQLIDVERNLEKFIKRGFSLELLASTSFSRLRNDPFDLSQTKEFHLDFIPNKGIVNEHINGRLALGVYFFHAYRNGEIKDYKDTLNWYLRYCVWIKTDEKFNQIMKKFQNENDAAIDADLYINQWENYFNEKLDEEQKTEFKKHFLSTNYGQVTKIGVVRHVKRDLEIKENPMNI